MDKSTGLVFVILITYVLIIPISLAQTSYGAGDYGAGDYGIGGVTGSAVRAPGFEPGLMLIVICAVAAGVLLPFAFGRPGRNAIG